MSASILSGVEMAPRDPILGVTEAYHADKNPHKVNLGVGVYTDDSGKVPVLECVKRAERAMLENPAPRNYLPIDGIPAYDHAVQALVFGAASPVVKEGRVVTVQALGGTGALKLAADFLRRVDSNAEVWISNPTWENHRGIFENAGFKVSVYPYYDSRARGLDFTSMIDALNQLSARSIVVLHACCHNPTGVDLALEQWTRVLDVVEARELVPILDIAYQGFADGLDADGAVVRLFAENCASLFVANSFSKSFSLYGERVGALSIVAENADEAVRVLSQIKRVVRTNYSNPPTHGGQIVATVLTRPELQILWENELSAMRDRIKAMRQALVEHIHARVPDTDFSFVMRQRGMFSYSGLSKEAVHRLREEFAVYAIDSGRICVAALNSHNVEYAADSIASVIRG
jgi:aromatic-amino-acid transaminase